MTDILLIGAGPIGIEMAAALKHSRLDYLHVDAGQIGATMQWWAPGTRWFSSNDRISIAGVPLVTPMQEKATREEYLAYLRSIVLQFDLQIETYTRVVAIERMGGSFVVRARRSFRGTHFGEELLYRAKRIILSTGGTEHPNLLNVPGENLPQVSHYFQDPHIYFNRDLLVVGGRNSAVETALRCHRAGAKVHFSYRRAGVDAKDIKYWLYPEFTSLLESGAITPHFNTLVNEITPTHAVLTGCFAPNSALSVPADFVLLMTGYIADMSLAKMVGVDLTGDQDLPAYDAETMETGVPGVYVIGTAIAGSQRRYKVFLENCHVHVERTISHLTGRREHVAEPAYDRPES